MKNSENFTDKLIKNTVYNNIGYCVRIFLSLALTPYIFNQLGKEQFGIWIFASAFVGYFALLDFGVGAAVVKYTAEYFAVKSYDKISKLIISALICYGSLSLFLIPVILFRNSLVGLFRIEETMRDDLSFVFFIATFSFAVSFVFSVFRNILIGLQRMDLTTKINMLFAILNAVGTVLVLRAGFGIRGLVILALAVHILIISTQYITLRVIYPWTMLNFTYIDFNMIRCFFSYGIKIQLSAISGLISFHLDKVLIGYFLNMTLVGFYEIGAKIAGFIRGVPMLMLPVIMPAASELDALENKNNLKKLYFKASKYLVMIAMPLMFILITLAPTIMYVWIKVDAHSKAVLTLRILGVGYFFNIITGVVTSIARGIGKPEYEMRVSGFIVVINLLLSIILIIKFGFTGALAGTVIALIVGNTFYLVSFHIKHIQESFTGFLFKIYIKPFAASILASGLVYSSQKVLYSGFFGIESTRINCAIYLILAGICFAFLYLFILILTRFIQREDFLLLKKIKL